MFLDPFQDFFKFQKLEERLYAFPSIFPRYHDYRFHRRRSVHWKKKSLGSKAQTLKKMAQKKYS